MVLPWRLLLISWLFVGLSVLLVTPPLQSPDELHHLQRAYMLSQGQWFLTAPPEESSGGYVDRALVTFYHAAHGIIAGERLTKDKKNQITEISWAGQEHFVSAPGTGYYFPLIYGPQALGLAIGEQLDWTVYDSYQLSRFLTLSVCFIILFFAFLLAPPNPLVLAIIMLPMALFQSASTNLDGLIIALVVLALSAFHKLASSTENQNGRLLAVFTVVLLIVLTARVNLFPLLLLPAALWWKHRSSRFLLATAVIGVLVAIWTLTATMSVVDLRTDATQVSLVDRLITLIDSPALFFESFWVTVSDAQYLRFYLAGFVGILGWLNITFDQQNYEIWYAFLGLSALLSLWMRSSVDTVPAARGLLITSALLSAFAVFFLMWLTWTPPDHTHIIGVQGRYFLPMATLLAYAFGTGASRWPIAATVTLITMLIYTQAMMLTTLLDRYYITGLK